MYPRRTRLDAERSDELLPMAHGPWNPGIQSQIPPQLCVICARSSVPENVSRRSPRPWSCSRSPGLRVRAGGTAAAATGAARAADPGDGRLLGARRLRIEDLGINFREMTGRLLRAAICSREMAAIAAEYERLRRQLTTSIEAAYAQICSAGSARAGSAGHAAAALSGAAALSARLVRPRGPARSRPASPVWLPDGVRARCRTSSTSRRQRERSAATVPAYRALARVLAALFATHGRAWGTRR